jgi:hypothetical protein
MSGERTISATVLLSRVLHSVPWTLRSFGRGRLDPARTYNSGLVERGGTRFVAVSPYHLQGHGLDGLTMCTIQVGHSPMETQPGL